MTHTGGLAARRCLKCHNIEKANKQGSVQALALRISKILSAQRGLLI